MKPLGGLYAVNDLMHLHFYKIVFIFWRATDSKGTGMKQRVHLEVISKGPGKRMIDNDESGVEER